MLSLTSVGKDEWVFDADRQHEDEEFECINQAMDLLESDKEIIVEQILIDFLSKFPESIAVCSLLAEIYATQDKHFQSYLINREAVRIGLDALPKKFDWKKSKLNWGFIENRPFLRAYYRLGLTLKEQNKLVEAAQIFERLLSVCPNDNIGARSILPEIYFLQANYQGVMDLALKYPNDMLSEVTFGAVLATALLGDLPKAKIMLAAAAEKMPLVVKELKKKRHRQPKSLMEGMITIGGADQAYEYWQDFGKFWQTDMGVELLASV